MIDADHTPIDVEKIATGFSRSHFQTLSNKSFLGIEWDLYSIILFATGLLFIISLLVWGYMRFTAS